jgi:uridine phosphorylase
MTALVDKSAVGTTARQYHIGVAPGEVGSVALLPGDPFRVPLIAELLTDVKLKDGRRHSIEATLETIVRLGL